MRDIVERLKRVGSERQRTTAHDNPKHYLHIVAKISNADGLLMQEAADEITRLRAALDNAYNERNRLVAFLARLFPSGLKHTAIPGWDEAWHGCVYIDLPTGQASWHYHDREAYLFDGLPPYSGDWDGHSTELKYERIARAALEGK